jgi:hypothetical protein
MQNRYSKNYCIGAEFKRKNMLFPLKNAKLEPVSCMEPMVCIVGKTEKTPELQPFAGYTQPPRRSAVFTGPESPGKKDTG